MNKQAVEVGTRWRQNDPRMNGRTVVVTHLYASGQVAYRNVVTNRLAVSQPGLFQRSFTQLDVPVAPKPVSREALAQLVERWRAEGLQINSFHATMGTGYTVCADELEALLSTAPPATPAADAV